MIIHIDRAKKKVSIKKEPAGAKAKQPKGPYVVIDYPKNGDILEPHHYSIRIGASVGHDVQVSIDKGPWQPARENSGYYWYDWHDISIGQHSVVARITFANGKTKKSKAVNCQA